MITLTAKLIGLSDGDIIIDYKTLISLNRSIFYRNETKLPSYGILSNNGNLEFNDFDGTILSYAERLLLTSDLEIEINLNNTLTGLSEKVGVFKTKDWEYDNNNKTVSVSLKDDLEEWQDIQVKGFSCDPRKPNAVLENKSMADLYKWLQAQDENGNYRTPQKYKMLSFDELDEITKKVLNSITIDYPFLNDGTLWEQWQKLCEVCALYIYKNNQGRTVCIYSYGS